MTDILGLPAGALEGLDEADVQRVLNSPVPDITAGYLRSLRRLQREAAAKQAEQDTHACHRCCRILPDDDLIFLRPLRNWQSPAWICRNAEDCESFIAYEAQP